MTTTEPLPAVPAAAGPEPLERGRYAIYPDGAGGAGIYRAVYLCDACSTCGCGEQQPAVPIPAMVLPFITGESTPKQRVAAFRKMLRSMLGSHDPVDLSFIQEAANDGD